MSDQPKWMPSDDDMETAASWISPIHEDASDDLDPDFEPMRALIRAAVEKRDAEWALASGLETKHGDPDGLTPEKMAKFFSDFKAASTIALDQIAALCGCPTWEYPGQVVRDVEKALAEREARHREDLRVITEATRMAADKRAERHKRELLEARIYECEEYGDCICERYSDPTLNVRHRDCEVCKHLDSLRAELAALEVGS